MATTGVMPGRIIRIYSGASPTAITHATEGSIEFSSETTTRVTKDTEVDGWQTAAQTTLSATINGTALYADDATNGFEDLWDAMTGRTTVDCRFSTEVSGDIYYSGTFHVTSLNLNAAADGDASFTFTLQSEGEVTKADVA